MPDKLLVMAHANIAINCGATDNIDLRKIMAGVRPLYINKFNGLHRFSAVAQHNAKKVPGENIELSPEI
ncbi:MAG: hypothetical protein ACO3WT_06355 [Candidatus Puniceispirillaceae bacterium]